MYWSICGRRCRVAFRNAYLYDIAPQLGTRISRRLKGEYVMTTADFAYAIEHDDVIAWHSTICQVNDCGPWRSPTGPSCQGCGKSALPGPPPVC